MGAGSGQGCCSVRALRLLRLPCASRGCPRSHTVRPAQTHALRRGPGPLFVPSRTRSGAQCPCAAGAAGAGRGAGVADILGDLLHYNGAERLTSSPRSTPPRIPSTPSARVARPRCNLPFVNNSDYYTFWLFSSIDRVRGRRRWRRTGVEYSSGSARARGEGGIVAAGLNCRSGSPAEAASDRT